MGNVFEDLCKPETVRKGFFVYLDKEVSNAFDALCREHNAGRSAVVARLIADCVASYRDRNEKDGGS